MTVVARQIATDGDAEERMCALTRTHAAREKLIRFVVSPDGELVPDLKQVLPGRGVWLTATRQSVEQAIRRKLFARALKAAVSVPEDLPARIGTLLLREAMSTLSLASKAGMAVAGFDKVAAQLERGKLRVLLAATDGAADGRGKLAARLRNSGTRAELIDCFASADLDLALGRTNVIHAAITPGGLAEKFLVHARRYSNYGHYGAAEERETDTQ
jgi:predicted RNA-binding protein YlxR (DUF448 family)